VALNLDVPHSVNHMFGGWLVNVDKTLKSLALLGARALCCAIWFNRNDIVFEQSKYFLLCRLSSLLSICYISGLGCRNKTRRLWLQRLCNS
jgi:hypothetical protein